MARVQGSRFLTPGLEGPSPLCADVRKAVRGGQGLAHGHALTPTALPGDPEPLCEGACFGCCQRPLLRERVPSP